MTYWPPGRICREGLARVPKVAFADFLAQLFFEVGCVPKQQWWFAVSRACWRCPNGEMRGFLWFPKINRICKGSERGIGLKIIDLGSKNEINSGDQEKKHDK